MSNLTQIPISQPEAKVIAKNLQSLLKAKQVSESEIASAINMPVMTVRRIVSGETPDPRISTIKLLADYFGVTVDNLLRESKYGINSGKVISRQRNIPIISWETVSNSKLLQNINLHTWERWHPLSLTEENPLSESAFALESRPSMRPRYPLGTLFIIDPLEKPIDADIVLVKLKRSNELSLRQLIIDPPKWQLQPIVAGSEVIFYEKEKMEMLGVVVLTLLLNRKDRAEFVG